MLPFFMPETEPYFHAIKGSRTITKIPGGKKLQLCYKSNLFTTSSMTVTYNNTPQ